MNITAFIFVRIALILLAIGGISLTSISISYVWREYSHIEKISCFVTSCEIDPCQILYSSTCKQILIAKVSIEINEINVNTTIKEEATSWELECTKLNNSGIPIDADCYWDDRKGIINSLSFSSGYDDAVVFTLIMLFFVFGLLTVPSLCILCCWLMNSFCFKPNRRRHNAMRRMTQQQQAQQAQQGDEEEGAEEEEQEKKPNLEEIVAKRFVLRMSRLLLAPRRMNYKRNRYKRTLIEAIIRNSVVDCGKNMNLMFVGKVIEYGKNKQTLRNSIEDHEYDLDSFVHELFVECSEQWNNKKSQFEIVERNSEEFFEIPIEEDDEEIVEEKDEKKDVEKVVEKVVEKDEENEEKIAEKNEENEEEVAEKVAEKDEMKIEILKNKQQHQLEQVKVEEEIIIGKEEKEIQQQVLPQRTAQVEMYETA